MKNRGNAGSTLFQAFVVALGFAAMAHGGLGYLPLVGPPPLRLFAVKNTEAAVAQINLTADTNLAATLAVADSIKMPAASALVLAGETNSTGDVLPLGLGEDNGAVNPFGPSVFSLASPDLLNITPQMLAAYFHPVARGTNSAADVVVPMPVIFMPPAVRAAPSSSHAEYIVK